MASMFDPIKAVLTPEMFATVGSKLGVPAETVQQGVDIAIPLLTRGVASIAETPEGQVRIADAVKNADTGLLGNLSGFLGGVSSDGGGDMLARVFGDEGRVVTSLVKQHTGMDITPFLGMAGPLLLGLMNSTAAKEGLDTNGLVKLIRSEARSFDRKKSESAVLVDTVIDQVAEVRKLKGSFSAAEWATLRSAPLAAAATVIDSAPSSDRRAAKETTAALASIPESTKDAAATSLIAALFHGGVDGISADGIEDPMATVKHAAGLVKQHAAGEAAAYNKVLLNAAYAAAEAVKEGGFLGVGAKRVSPAEQGAIDTLAAALGV